MFLVDVYSIVITPCTPRATLRSIARQHAGALTPLAVARCHGAVPSLTHCAVPGGCQEETYGEKEGLNPWVTVSGRASRLRSGTTESSLFAKAGVVDGCAVPFCFFVILGKLLITDVATVVDLVATVLAFAAWKKTHRKATDGGEGLKKPVALRT